MPRGRTRPAFEPAAARDELASAVQARILDRETTVAVLAVAAQDPVPAPDWPANLTDRELNVLGQLAGGAGDTQIAADLGITAKAVAHHVQHIYDKFGVRSRAGVTLFTIEHRLLR